MILKNYSDLKLQLHLRGTNELTHLPLELHVSGNWVSIGSGNGLSPVRRQAITQTNADLLSTRPFGTNFSEIQIKIQNFPLMTMYLKMLFVNGGHFV